MMSPTFLFVFSITTFYCSVHINANHENSIDIIPDSIFGGETSDSEFPSSMFSDLPTSIHSYVNNVKNQPMESLPQNDGLKGSIEYFLDTVKNMPKFKLQNLATQFSKIINQDLAAPETSNNILNEIPKTSSVENALGKVLDNPKSLINSVEENFLEMLQAPGLQSEDIPKIKSGFKNAFKASDLSLSDISAIQRGVLKVLNVPGQKIPAVLQNVAKNLILPSPPGNINPTMMLSPEPEFLNPLMMLEPKPEYFNPTLMLEREPEYFNPNLMLNAPPQNFMMNLLQRLPNFGPIRAPPPRLPQLGAVPHFNQMRIPSFPTIPQMNIPRGLPNLNFGGNMIQLPEIARELFASIQSLEKGLNQPKRK